MQVGHGPKSILETPNFGNADDGSL
ncbi:unnamed protein product, partial [Rotaria magnacalcarata]